VCMREAGLGSRIRFYHDERLTDNRPRSLTWVKKAILVEACFASCKFMV
jgi:hypothetical protein